MAIIRDVLLVGLGAVVGALVRFGTSSVLPTKTFPWATLAVNLVGSLLIGLLVLPGPIEHGTRLLVVVGFLGALTTLSTYSAETVTLWRDGRIPLAFANLVANGVGGPLAAVLGWKMRS